ncbi:ribonuclease H-like domain-containing protein [Paenibacillus protaetiae]|uniref:YprB ribonuclease H-like domain-containing protein n=1 Tax=Paenibacillus protaetiae TaxID=2509456 RepID=A0A4P6EV56_9BACL|nr:ribonuclease H-like domain-containing protein [Paenibacillus protaetiae]QAY66043.1 hypothetical protein ET464_06210 [Paenibacillus protaetiae]
MSGLRERMSRLRGDASALPAETAAAAEKGITEASAAAVIPASPESGAGEVCSAEAAVAAPGLTPSAAANPARAGAQPSPPPSQEKEEDELGPEWAKLGVKLIHNEMGSFLLRRVTYAADYRHGTHHLAELADAAAHLSAFHPGEPVDDKHILFLDLETTGLGVGAGNVPFMIGLGYAGAGQFTIEQALIRHPAEERAMLDYLDGLVSRFRFLATYNGRTFDWPVLQNRFILNGFRNRTWQPLHLDFLHPARSIWRNTLPSCKLSYVEESRLGIARQDDVPGLLAPQLYFQFLADGKPGPLEGVFRHNEIDMLSLACLAVRFGYLLGDERAAKLPLPSEPEELVRTGLWLERMGARQQAERMFSAAAGMSGRTAYSALLLLAARDKKAGNWSRAVLLWQKAIDAQSAFGANQQEAYVELAMYYEHKIKNIELAIYYTKEALELAVSHPLAGRMNPKRRAELDALRRRLDRLHRKAAAQR